MKCAQCSKLILEAEPHYTEQEADMLGIVQTVPKYWLQNGTVREVFCSPHCATAWHKCIAENKNSAN